MAVQLTRRQALGAGAAGALAGGAGLVKVGALPGRERVGRLLGACDLGDPPPTTTAPGPLRFAAFPSRQRGLAVGYGVAWPRVRGRATGSRSACCCTPPPGTSGPRSSGCACTTTSPRRPTRERSAPSPWPRPTAGAAAG